jgi:RNA polymerase sigma-70 factor (ECF subfamily)
MVGDNAEAEDLAQDSFLQLFRSIHSFRGESAFATWLHRVVVTVVLGRIRKKTLPTVPWDGDSEFIAHESRRLEADPALRELTENPLDRVGLQQAVMQLPFTFRAILILHDVQGYRHIEISRILGVPIGTSKSYLHRARLQMRRLLDANETPRPSQDRTPGFRSRRLRKRNTMEDAVVPSGSGN